MLRKTFLLTIALSVLCPPGWSLATSGVLLRHKLTPGSIARYKMTIDMTSVMPGSGKGKLVTNRIRTSGIIKTKVLGLLRDGSAKMMVSVNQFKMELPGAGAPSTIPDESFTLIIDRSGRIIKRIGEDGSPPGASPADAWNIGGLARLPGRRVKVGDIWSGEIPIPGMRPGLKIRSKLVSLGASVAGKRAANITHTYEGRLKFTTGAPNPDPGRSKAESTVTFSGTGTTYFSVEKGKVLQTTADTEVTISGSQGGAPMRIRMHFLMTAI